MSDHRKAALSAHRGATQAGETHLDESDKLKPVSLNVLCRRAERLIDSVRAAQEQVERIYAQPERLAAEANDITRSLERLRESVEGKLETMRELDQSCGKRLRQLHQMMHIVRQATIGLAQRVANTRRLSDEANAWIRQVEAQGRPRIQAILDRESLPSGGSAETNQVVPPLLNEGRALADRLEKVMHKAFQWQQGFHQDVQVMRDLLERSQRERQVWQVYLDQAAAGSIKVESPNPGEAVSSADSSLSTPVITRSNGPAALAERIRKVGDLIRQIGQEPVTAANPEGPTGKTVARERIVTEKPAVQNE